MSNKGIILIIEPDRGTVNLYTTYFSNREYTVVDLAEGGAAAMLSIQPTVVVAEPGSATPTGEFVRKFRTAYPTTSLIIASSRKDLLSGTKHDNKSLALTKPFHMEELQELIEVSINPSLPLAQVGKSA